jgi:cytosine/adenosine deaminase-related metal-dependent hydrolase
VDAVLRFEHLPPGSLASRRAIVRWSDGTEGKRADVIVVDAKRPHLQPLNEPLTTVVMNAGPADVDTVIVTGKSSSPQAS